MAYRRPAYFAGSAYPATKGASTRTAAATLTPNKSLAPTSVGSRTTPFNYDSWYRDDLTLQALITQINQAGLNLGTNLVGGEQQIFGRLGEAPDLSQPQYANLPPELRAALERAVNSPDLQAAISAGNLAGTNALSRLNYDYRLGQSQDVNALAGRNMLRSGAYGQESAKNLRGLTLGQYDARLGATDALQALQNTYLTGQDALAAKTAEGITASQKRASELGLLAGTTTPTTITNPYLNPAVPKQVSTGVQVGSTTTYEPKPTAGNYIPTAAPRLNTTPKLTAPKLAAPVIRAAPTGTRALR